MNNLVAIAYVISGILFIMALRGLSSPESSRRGNIYGMMGMFIAIAATLFSVDFFNSNFQTLLLVVIAIVIFISSLSYPSFSSWLAARNTNDAVIKIESAFRSITTQVQRGVYPFGQIQIQNTADKIVIVTKGMGQETFGQERSNTDSFIQNELTRCSHSVDHWDNNSINFFET